MLFGIGFFWIVVAVIVAYELWDLYEEYIHHPNDHHK